jgi:D-alanyl-lipoteichoic acid acyltransferase DltB (MBOAT superfamily)
MLFQSQEFALVLLPTTLLLYYAVAKYPGPRKAVLIFASLIFYAWWDFRFLPLFLGHIVVAWAGPILARRTGQRSFIDLAIALQLVSLALFKYSDFIVENIEAVLGITLAHSSWLLPIGISFFTFQLVSYLIDVRRGDAAPYPLTSILLYISFFPHLIAGPIVRHNELLPQFDEDPLRSGLPERLGKGAALFIIGMAKKVLLADQLAALADPIFAASAAQTNFATMWTGAIAFSLQLFLDFSAYSEMAIGLALMFGLWLPENFNTPYRALDLRDFWRRWHITLSTFLRDYVYIPLGGNRHGVAQYVLATLITMGACGLWHGAGWNFVIWGLFHGCGLLVCTAYQARAAPLHPLLAWLVTMLFVIFGWVIFRAPDMTSAASMLQTMVGSSGFSGHIGSPGLLLVASAVAIMVPSSYRITNAWLPATIPAASVLGLGFTYLLLHVGRSQPMTFIYFQF